MRSVCGMLLAVACSFQMGCSRPPTSVPKAAAHRDPPRIMQFYATAPTLARGEQELLCYGVSDAKTVWLSPPKHELSAALSRCVEVEPTATTTYTLTAEGDGGLPASSQLTVTLGAPRAKLDHVTVSALETAAGEAVSLCYDVQQAKSVSISPIGFHGGPANHGCTMVRPAKTTTYVVTAIGADGDRDEQPVTVTVK